MRSSHLSGGYVYPDPELVYPAPGRQNLDVHSRPASHPSSPMLSGLIHDDAIAGRRDSMTSGHGGHSVSSRVIDDEFTSGRDTPQQRSRIPIDPALLGELPSLPDWELSPPRQIRALPSPVQSRQNTDPRTLDAKHASTQSARGQAFHGLIDPEQLDLRFPVRHRQSTSPPMLNPTFAFESDTYEQPFLDPALPEMPSSPSDKACWVGVDHATPENADTGGEARANSGLSDAELAVILKMHIGAEPNMTSPAMRPERYSPAAEALSASANVNRSKYLHKTWDDECQRWVVRYRPPGVKQECATFPVAGHGSKAAAEQEAHEAIRKFIYEGVSLHESAADARERRQVLSARATRERYTHMNWHDRLKAWQVSFRPRGEKSQSATFAVALHGGKAAAEEEAQTAMQKFIEEGGSLREIRQEAKKRAASARWAQARQATTAPRVAESKTSRGSPSPKDGG